MNMRANLAHLVLFLLLLTAASSLCAAQTYTVTDLGTSSRRQFQAEPKAIQLSAEILVGVFRAARSATRFFTAMGR